MLKNRYNMLEIDRDRVGDYWRLRFRIELKIYWVVLLIK
jgi:hypothetical protein